MSPRKDSMRVQRDLLADEDTFATVLLVIFANTYGTEGLQWHPTTMRLELESDFGIQFPEVNSEKLSAATALMTTDAFYKRATAFIKIANALNGAVLPPGVFDPADAMESAWAITEALLIDPPDEDEPFSEEVQYYIGGMLNEEGIKNPPDVLRIGRWEDQSDYGTMSVQDPTMFQAESKFHLEEAEAIEEELRKRLRGLFDQLERTGLGDTEKLVANFRSNLHRGRKKIENDVINYY